MIAWCWDLCRLLSFSATHLSLSEAPRWTPEQHTCTLMVSMRQPVSLIIIVFGGLSRPRRSRIMSFPFSAPAYIAPPSAENSSEVSGTLRLKVRNNL